MSRTLLPTGELGFEAFGTACGLAVVAGALSVVAPMFDLLTATLAALALAGWAALHRRDGRPSGLSPRWWAPYTLPFALLGAATVVFVDPPGPAGPCRALLLGLGLVPLWVLERRPPYVPGLRGSSP
jgi:hypothetical protein